MLNHLISDMTPRGDYANADPVTGQAAWFDLRVSLRPAAGVDDAQPQFGALPGAPAPDVLRYSGGKRGAAA